MHVASRAVTIHSCHDPINSIRFTIHTFRPTMSKEHKIHQNTSASNYNIIIWFVMFDKNEFVGIFWQQIGSDCQPGGHTFEPCHRHLRCVLLVKQPK